MYEWMCENACQRNTGPVDSSGCVFPADTKFPAKIYWLLYCFLAIRPQAHRTPAYGTVVHNEPTEEGARVQCSALLVESDLDVELSASPPAPSLPACLHDDDGLNL
ncbi:hypothetical protein STEG23_009452 [Scotinomys teguina]